MCCHNCTCKNCQIAAVMSLQFDEELTDQISLVADLPEQILIDFCKLAIDYTETGEHNTKKYNIAAQKLKCPIQKIENTITSIIKVLIEACKNSISESEFSNTVQSLGLKEGHITILQKLYNAKKSHISNFVPKISYRPLRYVGIEWRLEAQFTSRFEPDVIKPYVILDITTKKDTFHTLENIENNINEVKNSNKSVKDVYTDMKSDDSVEHILLKCDLPNLINMISVLETAWRESHAGHVRKIEYAINRSEAPTENGKTE